MNTPRLKSLSPDVLEISLSMLTPLELTFMCLASGAVQETVQNYVSKLISKVAQREGLYALRDRLGALWLMQVDIGARDARVATGDWNGLVIKNFACFSFGADRRGLGRQIPADAQLRELGTPRRVGGELHTIRISRVAVGSRTAFASGEDGGFFSWGSNERGQLGLGDTQDRTMPTPVPDFNDRIVSCVAADGLRALAISGGDVYVWGPPFETRASDVLAPYRFVVSADAAPLISASVGAYFGVVLDSEGGVWWCGKAEDTFHLDHLTPTLTRIPALQHVIQVVIGQDHLIVLLATGSVYDQHNEAAPLPVVTTVVSIEHDSTLAVGLNNLSIVYVHACTRTSFAVSEAGELFAWGFGGGGDLVTGTTEYHLTIYERVEALRSVKIRSLGGVVGLVAVAINVETDDEEFYTWGATCVYTSKEDQETHRVKPRRFELDTPL